MVSSHDCKGMTSDGDWPNILRLSDYRIGAIRETEHDYHVQIETLTTKTSCPQCHGAHCVGYGRSELLIHDLPMHAKRVALYINARRFRCRDCGKTFMESLPGMDGQRRMTERLARWIGPPLCQAICHPLLM